MTRKIKTTLLLATCYLLLLSCSKQESPLYQEQILALGALVDISIWGAEPELARRASNAIAEDFNRIHTTWHAWEASPLTRINETIRSGAAANVDAEMIALIAEAKELSAKSGGLFNPAVGKLIASWGFHSDEPHGPPPDAKTIETLVAAHPSMDALQIEGHTLKSNNPAVQLDFGAIGQGYAVDVAIAHLRKLGIRNAIVNASGDIRVIGKHGGRPWRIGIRDPRGSGIIASIEMQGDESIVTSGSYERFYDYQGKRYHHIIDPRSGYPARGVTSVTVLHSDATTADAASTALLAAGLKGWQKTARDMGVKQVMMIDEQGIVHMDPALTKRIHFEVTPPPKVEIVSAL